MGNDSEKQPQQEIKNWKDSMNDTVEEVMGARVKLLDTLHLFPSREELSEGEKRILVSGVIALKSIDSFLSWYAKEVGDHDGLTKV